MQTYTIDEWFEDYEYALDLVPDSTADPNAVGKALLDHFCSKYPDDAGERCHLLWRALCFVEAHMDALSKRGIADAGERFCSVREPLLRALHEFFTTLIDKNRLPSVEQILILAKKHGG
jgi:hypothetical protein